MKQHIDENDEQDEKDRGLYDHHSEFLNANRKRRWR